MYDIITIKKIVAGSGAIDALGREVKNLQVEKVLIVTDKGVVNAGIVDKALKPLKKEGIKFEIFDEIEPNPKDTTVEKGAQYLRDTNAEAVIGIGGGSSMDAAKVIAVLSCNKGSVEKYYDDFNETPDPFENQGKPVITVATTSGTGSEVTPGAMITDTKNNIKRLIVGWSIVPVVAITDPLLTLSLPARLTAETGMDALVHAIEAYISKSANPISDADAYCARAFSNVGLGMVHSLGQTISGKYNAPHGLTMAVFLPISMEYNFMATPERCADIAKIMGKNINGLSTIDAARLSIEGTRELLNDLNIAEDIKSMGVTEESISVLAELAMKDNCTSNNPRSINTEGYKQLYYKLYSRD
jgi:1,3-propanediol dehydrogenase